MLFAKQQTYVQVQLYLVGILCIIVPIYNNTRMYSERLSRTTTRSVAELRNN